MELNFWIVWLEYIDIPGLLGRWVTSREAHHKLKISQVKMRLIHLTYSTA